MIKRNIENIIEDSLKHYLIILLTGPRQIGKSTQYKKGYNAIICSADKISIT